MPTQRASAGDLSPGRLRRPLAAALLALLMLLLPAVTSARPAFAAPAEPAHPRSAPEQPSPGRATWSVQGATHGKPDNRPTLTYAGVEPGASHQDAVAVRNFGAVPLKLAVYASDAHNTGTGGFDLLPAADRPVDVGSWVRMAKSALTVPAGATVVVPFTLAVPRNATPGFHVGGIVASFSGTALDAKGNTVRVDRRVGVRLFLQVSGPLRPQLVVRDVTVDYRGGWDPVHPGTATVGYTVTNTGNVPLQAHRTLHTEGLLGVFGRTGEQPDVPLLLPGNSVRLSARLTGVWPGGRLHARVELAPYTAVVALSTAVPPATAGATAGAVPWTWLIAVLVLLAAAGPWARRRLRGRAAAPAKGEAPALSRAG